MAHFCTGKCCGRLDYLWRPTEAEWRKGILDTIDMRTFVRRPLSDADYRDAVEVMLGLR